MVTISEKQVLKTSIFELSRVKSCISRLCTKPLGARPKTCFALPNIKKTSFENFDF